jgi:2-amino-4-hydroxy-6-hydroxymethyldihydropteridine diphosphokinase
VKKFFICRTVFVNPGRFAPFIGLCKVTKIGVNGRNKTARNPISEKEFQLSLNPMNYPDVFISLGSNSGRRELMLEAALHGITKLTGQVLAASSIYETAPWGKLSQPLFLNQVIRVVSPLEPVELLEALLATELRLGRERKGERWGERTIDIDLLFAGPIICNTPLLRLPHPELASRRFVLVPLAELAPAFRHPITHQTVAEMLDACTDLLPVNKWAAPVN